jgi:hypothetical protein
VTVEDGITKNTSLGLGKMSERTKHESLVLSTPYWSHEASHDAAHEDDREV